MSRAAMEQARDALALCRLNGSQYLYGPERDVVFSALAALDAALAEQPAATADAALGAAIEAIDAALAKQKCPCGDRPADQCPGEWEPGCDLGANEKHAKVAEQAQPVAWISVAERLPASGQIVLACYVNRAGRLRRIRAEWVADKSREASSEGSDIGVYDEDTDTYYDPEGWYERIDNWGDYSAVVVTEGEVTHWMPLPPEPGAAPEAPTPPAPQPLTDEDIEAIPCTDGDGSDWEALLRFARAVEAEVLKRMGVKC